MNLIGLYRFFFREKWIMTSSYKRRMWHFITHVIILFPLISMFQKLGFVGVTLPYFYKNWFKVCPSHKLFICFCCWERHIRHFPSAVNNLIRKVTALYNANIHFTYQFFKGFCTLTNFRRTTSHWRKFMLF